jgi:hypothetical protein
MSLMDELGNLAKQVTGSGSAPQSQELENQYSQLSQSSPSSALSAGLSDVFRSNQTPPFAQLVSQLFQNSNSEQRAGILSHLTGALGGGGGLSSGILGSLAGVLGGNSGSSITPEQADKVSPDQVKELAEHAEKQDPSIIDQVSSFYSQHPTLVQSLGVGALAMVMSHLTQGKR